VGDLRKTDGNWDVEASNRNAIKLIEINMRMGRAQKGVSPI
jgi:hypothetical protein